MISHRTKNFISALCLSVLIHGAASAQSPDPFDGYYFKSFKADTTTVTPLGMIMLSDRSTIVYGNRYTQGYPHNLKVHFHDQYGEFRGSYEYPAPGKYMRTKRIYRSDAGGFLAVRIGESWIGPLSAIHFDSAFNVVSETVTPVDTIFSPSFTDLLSTGDGGYVLVKYREFDKPRNSQYPPRWYSHVVQPYCGRITPKGDTLWWKQLTHGTSDWGFNVFLTSAHVLRNGDFVFTGFTRDQEMAPVYTNWMGTIVFKTDADGNQKWLYAVGFFYTWPKAFYDAVELDDGSIVVVGSDTPLGNQIGRAQFAVLSPDSGKLLRQRFYGTEFNGYDNFSFVRRMRDGGFLFAGEKSKHIDTLWGTNAWFLRTDGQGNVRWSREFNIDRWTYTNSIELTPDEECVALVNSNNYYNNTGNEIWPINTVNPTTYTLLKLGARGEVSAVESPTEERVGAVLGAGYPNPAHVGGMLTIPYTASSSGHLSIVVHDALGRPVRNVYDGNAEPGDHAVSFSPSGLAPGVYHARLRTEKGIMSRKLVVLR
jgi:hypothetical protein